MKILIDGHNFSLKEPTGIGVYAYNLAAILNEVGYNINILYDIFIPIFGFKKSEVFFQNLANSNRVPSNANLYLLYSYLNYFLKFKKIEPIIINKDNLLLQGLNKKIPPNINILNYSNIFRLSQAYASLQKNNVKISSNIRETKIDLLHLSLIHI